MEKEKSTSRQRKKKLVTDVKSLLEFYFSPANLRKDAFMNKLLKEGDGYIDINVFHKFNKIKNLTDDTHILRKAIKYSDILELSEDKERVKRSVPAEMKENEMQCTIYVENLPVNASHEWITKVFSAYGVIDYISIPRFQHNGQPKGFAFVEFNTPEESQRALDAFGGGFAALDGTVNPSDLLSIKTFGKDKTYSPEPGSTTDAKIGTPVFVPNLMKRSADEAPEYEKASKKKASDKSVAENKTKGKQKKRKRKKKEKEYELDTVYLRVMSKEDWKNLRNKYLDSQKEHMKQLKNSFQNYDLGELYSKKIHEESKGKQIEKDTSTRPEYKPDVIVKIHLKEPPTDTKEFREGITFNRLTVAYVDIRSGDSIVHIRFKEAEGAKQFIEEGLYDNVELLSGEEESCYWSRILTLWELRRPKKKKKPEEIPQYPNLPRGRDKLVNKALKNSAKSYKNSHATFSK